MAASSDRLQEQQNHILNERYRLVIVIMVYVSANRRIWNLGGVFCKL